MLRTASRISKRGLLEGLEKLLNDDDEITFRISKETTHWPEYRSDEFFPIRYRTSTKTELKITVKGDKDEEAE